MAVSGITAANASRMGFAVNSTARGDMSPSAKSMSDAVAVSASATVLIVGTSFICCESIVKRLFVKPMRALSSAIACTSAGVDDGSRAMGRCMLGLGGLGIPKRCGSSKNESVRGDVSPSVTVSSNSGGTTGAIANSSDRGDMSGSSVVSTVGKVSVRGEVIPNVSSRSEGLVEVIANSRDRGVSTA